MNTEITEKGEIISQLHISDSLDSSIHIANMEALTMQTQTNTLTTMEMAESSVESQDSWKEQIDNTQYYDSEVQGGTWIDNSNFENWWELQHTLEHDPLVDTKSGVGISTVHPKKYSIDSLHITEIV